jgi:hypothetical protein
MGDRPRRHGSDARLGGRAIDLRPRGRYAKRESITATGATEIEALGALAALLDAGQVSGRCLGVTLIRPRQRAGRDDLALG